MPLAFLRYTVFGIFALSALVAVAGWAVRTRRINPFGATGRFLRNATDPILVPLERWVVRRGGNPQAAGWWLFGITLVGGIVVISVAQWLAGQVLLAGAAATSGRGLIRLSVYYAGQLVMLALIVRVIGSWFGVGRYTRWMRPAYVLTDWIVEPLRRIIPPLGMFDITPLVAWFALSFLLRWLLALL